MGYCGLDNVIESDNAADLLSDVSDAVSSVLANGIKERDNWINTDGAINVALVFEDCIIGTHIYSDRLVKTARECLERLEKEIDEIKRKTGGWVDKFANANSEKNRKFHLKAYRRMAKSMRRWLRENE